MAEVQELRRGSVFVEEEQLWRVVDHQHIKMGRGSATVRLKVRNVRSGSTVEKTYTNGSRVQDVELDKDEVQFQYSDGDHYYFMNTETFETIPISKDLLDDVLNYLTDNTLVTLESFEGEPISVSMSTNVDLKVTWSDAAVAGDTAAGMATKIVEVESGYRLQTPMFVLVGDVIRINTREGTYVTRVKQ